MTERFANIADRPPAEWISSSPELFGVGVTRAEDGSGDVLIWEWSEMDGGGYTRLSAENALRFAQQIVAAATNTQTLQVGTWPPTAEDVREGAG